MKNKIVKNQKCKILKKKKKKSSRDIVKGTFPANLALICFMGSEKKTGFTDNRWTTDARVMTVALLCSSTKQS